MYRFYFDGVLLPVTPEKMEIKIKSKNKRLMLLNEGEVNLLKSPGLTEIAFEALLPNVEYPFAEYENGFKLANYYLGKLENLKTSRKAFRFIVSRLSPTGQLLFNTNILVSVEDYSIKEDASNNGLDVSAKIKFKQYRAFSTKIFALSEDGSTATIQENRVADAPDEFYIVKEGDTLYEIARCKLGDGEKYAQLMELNNIENHNSITKGQVLRLV